MGPVLNTERARNRSMPPIVSQVTVSPSMMIACVMTVVRVNWSISSGKGISALASNHGACRNSGTQSDCSGSRRTARSNASANAWRAEIGRRRGDMRCGARAPWRDSTGAYRPGQSAGCAPKIAGGTGCAATTGHDQRRWPQSAPVLPQPILRIPREGNGFVAVGACGLLLPACRTPPYTTLPMCPL